MSTQEFKVNDYVEIFQGSDIPERLKLKLGKVCGFSTRTGEPVVEINIPSEIQVKENLTNDTQTVESPSTILRVSVLNLRKVETPVPNTI
jgi:hypothetical protein